MQVNVDKQLPSVVDDVAFVRAYCATFFRQRATLTGLPSLRQKLVALSPAGARMLILTT